LFIRAKFYFIEELPTRMLGHIFRQVLETKTKTGVCATLIFSADCYTLLRCSDTVHEKALAQCV